MGKDELENQTVISFIGRLDDHKGIHLLINTILNLIQEKNITFIVLGRGNPIYEQKLQDIQSEHPGKIFIETKFSEKLAHKIYAGTDLFLMPSLFEPCGLGQLIAMRYGALPVVTPTGGLVDTVVSASENTLGTGVVSEDLTAGSYLRAVRSALSLLKNPMRIEKIRKNAMNQDFSWGSSIQKYMNLYEDK